MDAEQLSQALNQLLEPDTSRVKQAESALKPYLKNPLCLGGLLQQIQSNPNPGVRQIASVILRKRVHVHWGKLDPQSQAQLQTAVLAILQSEGERAVRKGVITVACVIARPCFARPETRWMVLFEFVNACCGAPQEEAREMGYILIEHLAEVIGSSLTEAVPSLVNVLHTGLMDQVPLVQAAALSATGQLMNALAASELLIQFADMIPPMLEVLKIRCSSGDEDVVNKVLEVIDELAESPVPVLNKHVPALVAFLLEMVKAPSLEHVIRDQAGMVLGSLAEFKPKLLGKKELVPSILEAMVHLMAETNESCAGSLYMALDDNQHDPNEQGGAAEEYDEDDEEADGHSPCQIAQHCIDKLACSLPMKYIWEPALQISVQCLSSEASNWKKAGAACLGNLAEGCQDPMRLVLEQILPLVLQAAKDPHQYTREAACFCLGQFAENLQPEIMRYQMEILPVVFPLLDDPLQSVQGISCYVLEMFSEHLTAVSVQPILVELTDKLVHLISNSPRLSIREMSMSCLASTAAAAEIQFLPFVATVVSCLVGPLQAMDEAYYTLRGRAIECLGHLAVAIGHEHFAQYLQLGMTSAEQSLQLDAPELHEFTYSFFGTVSKVMGFGFAPFLPSIVPHLCEVVARSDATEVNLAAEAGEFDLGDEEDDEEGGETYLQVRTALLDVKRTAVIALGMIAESSGPSFAEYLEKSVVVLLSRKDYFHDKIRIEVTKALGRMVRSAAVLSFGSIEAVPPVQTGNVQLPNGSQDVLVHVSNTVVKVLLTILYEDEHKMVVSQACESLQATLELLGGGVLGPYMQPNWMVSEDEPPCSLSAMQIVLQMLHEKAPCQMQPIESLEQHLTGEEDEDDDDHDNVLMDNVADLVGGIAKVFGPHFANYSAEFFDAMMKFAKASRPASDRAMAIGCFAEMIQFMGAHANQHVPVVLPIIQQGLKDQASGGVCRNAAFGIGMIAEANAAVIQPYVGSILSDLSPMFNVTHEQDSAIADNACSAVARIIMACPNEVPMEQVLPVFLSALPLKSDFSENDNVYKCLAFLFQNQNPVLLSQSQISAALSGVFHALTAEQVTDETKQLLIGALKQVLSNPQLNSMCMQTISSFPPEVAQVLQGALQ